ncbi:MAG: hypothetical protein ACXV4A_06460 [Actinomycetes bacterium]
MSIVTTALLTAALVAATAPAHAGVRIDPPCSTLTVTIADRADIPSGVSVRELMEGLIYPDLCR